MTLGEVFENTAGKKENDVNQHFLLFLHFFSLSESLSSLSPKLNFMSVEVLNLIVF